MLVIAFHKETSLRFLVFMLCVNYITKSQQELIRIICGMIKKFYRF